MIAFAYYLLKVFICSVILYGYYLLALRNKLFHYWNRFFLLGVIMVSLLVPLITIQMEKDPETVPATAIKILDVVSVSDQYVNEWHTSQKFNFTGSEILSIVYIIISLIPGFIFIRALHRINRIIRNHEIIKLEDIFFLNTAEKGTPFSFLQYIFWNREIEPDTSTGKRILKHEIIHVRQKHSWDQLFINAVLVVFWSNPVFWLIRKEIQMIHEFIADKETVADQDTSAFAEMILGAAYPGNRFTLTNQFFHSPIKRRLNMLLKSKNPKNTYFSRLLGLLLLLTVGAAFTLKTRTSDSESHIVPENNKSFRIIIDAGHGGNDAGARTLSGLEEKQLTLELARLIRDLNTSADLEILLTREDDITQPVKEKVDKAMSLQPDAFISIHINHSPGKAKNGFELLIGKNPPQLEKENRLLGSVINNELMKIYPTSGQLKQTERNNVYVLDAPQINYPSILIECGYLSNEKDLAFLSSPANREKIAKALLNAIQTFAAEKNKETAGREENRNSETIAEPVTLKASVFEWKNYPGYSNNSLLIINGKETDPAVTENKMIVSDSVTVFLKNDPRAIALYGTKAKDGAMIFHNASFTEKPSSRKFRDTLPKGVKSVDITESGEVIVMFSNGKAEKMTPEEAQKKGYIPLAVLEKNRNRNNNPNNIVIRGLQKNPLIFIDGVRIGKNDPKETLESEIKPGDIESIQVLKDEQAVNLYGEEARDGVLLIRTKHAAETDNRLKEVVVPGRPGKARITDPDEQAEIAEVREVELARRKEIKTESNQEVIIVEGKPASARPAKVAQTSDKPVTVNEVHIAEGKKISKSHPVTEEVVVAGEPVFTKTETAPRFPGGFEAFKTWLDEKVKEKAGKNKQGFKGSSTVRFVVFKSGKTGGVRVLNDHGNKALSDLVADILRNCPDWEPATQNGRQVSASQEFTLRFD